MNNKDALELIWRAGVARVGGHPAVVEALNNTDISATDNGPNSKPDAIIAIGKAATGMLEAALAFTGHDTRALLITKYGHVICRHKVNQAKLEEYQNDGTLQIIEAGHPLPDENSLAAGIALKQFVEKLEPKNHLLMLVSGGASALAELLPDDFSLEKLQNLNDEMLAQGLAIGEINRRRKEISQIKDGKLLTRSAANELTVLVISDVEGDSVKTVGSGIGSPHAVTANTAVRLEIIASNKIARDASAKKASLLGFEICENSETAYGDVEEVADAIANRLRNGGEGVYIFGGEPTVILPPNPGSGGRNQHLALLLAKKLEAENGIEFLVAGTDGSDGPGNAAGGFGDGESFKSQPGAQAALDQANSGEFLQQSGNLFVTGPTGTNVMDLIVVIKSG